MGQQASKLVLYSRLSREAPWFAFTPAGNGLVERGVVPHLEEDPFHLLAPLCCGMSLQSCQSSEVTNICGCSHRSIV